jgi:F-type H+-transporting ATPase subunit delta
MSDKGDQEIRPIADVGGQRIARVYAEALLNAALKRGELDSILEQYDSLVHDLVRADPSIAEFYGSPAIPAKVKAASIEAVFRPRASELFVNFLLVLNEHGRLDLFRQVFLALRELNEQRLRRLRVQVRSAVPLADDQRERLRRDLHDALQLDPILEEQVDPDLLGGVVVRVGDWQFDGSVRAQLRAIRNHIIARSSHEIQSGRDRFGTDPGN